MDVGWGYSWRLTWHLRSSQISPASGIETVLAFLATGEAGHFPSLGLNFLS